MIRGLAVLLASLTAGPALADPVGRFTIVEERVFSLKPGGRSARPARIGAKLVAGERVETGEDSAAQILLGEGAVVSLASQTSVVVSEREGETSGSTVPIVAPSRGLLRIFVSRLSPRPVSLHLPSAAASVEIGGAEAVVAIREDGSASLTALGGSGSVRWRRGSEGWREIAGGQEVSLGPGGDTGGPAAVDPDSVEALVARTRPTPRLPRWRPRARRSQEYALPAPDSVHP